MSAALKYTYWCQNVAQWELHEVCFLFLDKEPPINNSYELVISHRGMPEGKLFFALRKCLINEAKENGASAQPIHLNAMHVMKSPREWLRIAQKYGFEVPAVLAEKIEELTPRSEEKPKEKSMSERERESLLKMVLAAAIDCYGYEPNSIRNTATTDFENAISRIGLKLDADTIRKYLKEAAARFPDELKALTDD